VTAARLVASVVAATMALAFWWALTEPLPFAPAVLYAVPALILFIAGITAGRVGALAAPIALVFSLLLGSIIATPLHQAGVAGPLARGRGQSGGGWRTRLGSRGHRPPER